MKRFRSKWNGGRPEEANVGQAEVTTNLVTRARAFATAAHAGQLSRHSGQPYIDHLEAVAALVVSCAHTPEMIAAAWLHDVVEKTRVNINEIHREFGSVVAGLVDDLTDVSRPEDGNRSFRKSLDRAHTALASPDAKTIKLADVIDNSRSLLAHDADFSIIYLREKAMLLEVLQEGDQKLFQIAYQLTQAWA